MKTVQMVFKTDKPLNFSALSALAADASNLELTVSDDDASDLGKPETTTQSTARKKRAPGDIRRMKALQDRFSAIVSESGTKSHGKKFLRINVKASAEKAGIAYADIASPDVSFPNNSLGHVLKRAYNRQQEAKAAAKSRQAPAAAAAQARD